MRVRRLHATGAPCERERERPPTRQGNCDSAVAWWMDPARPYQKVGTRDPPGCLTTQTSSARRWGLGHPRRGGSALGFKMWTFTSAVSPGNLRPTRRDHW